MNINELRFSEDRFDHNFISIDKHEYDSNSNNKARKALYSEYVLVTDELFPDIYYSIRDTVKIIDNNMKLEVFIAPDPKPQSVCINLGRSRGLAIILTSSMVELLSITELKFVLGHEIAHYLFEHYNYPNPESAQNELEYLNLLYLSRCAEISADRVGFLCCPSLDNALMCILKVASGLSSQHIKFNVSSYINQLKELKYITTNGSDDIYRTHPIYPLRARALIWFSMSEQFYVMSRRSGTAPISRTKLDNMAKKDLHEISDRIYLEKENEIVENLILWTAIKFAIIDGKFAKKDQLLIKEYVNPVLVDKAVSFLKNSIGREAELVNEKFLNVVHQFPFMRVSTKSQIKFVIAEIGKRLNVSTKETKNIFDVQS